MDHARYLESLAGDIDAGVSGLCEADAEALRAIAALLRRVSGQELLRVLS